MKPALTAGEWKVMLEFSPRVLVGADQRSIGVSELRVELRHALAALALYGQPFGFTREDAEMVRKTARRYADGSPIQNDIIQLAERIEALLPHV